MTTNLLTRVAHVLAVPAIAGGMLGVYALAVRAPSRPPAEVAPGVVVSVEDLAPAPDGRGRMYLARVKLDPAKVDLYITPPLPPADRGDGFPPAATHRLAHTRTVARSAGLVVAVNASLFEAYGTDGASRLAAAVTGRAVPIRREGHPARTIETTVVEGQVVTLWEHAYMAGFLPDLTPDPSSTKPPPVERMPGWRWGIGTQSWQLFAGREGWWPEADKTCLRRTAFGFNPDTRELYLAVFDHASTVRAAVELRTRGATYAAHLDGSESSTFVLNGTPLTGDWRPVANVVGVRGGRGERVTR